MENGKTQASTVPPPRDYSHQKDTPMKKTPAERLDAAIRKALDAEKDIDAARRILENAIKDDAEILWLVFEAVRKSVLNELLRQHFAEKRGKTRNIERDKPWPKIGLQPKPKVKVRSHSRRKGVLSLSILDIYIVPELAKPLGDCRKEELVAVRDRHGARSRFYDMVQAPLPPLGIVRDFHSAEEIQRWIASNAPELNPREAA